MLDIRYHVISLVAVFLALGIGILLGTTLVERGLIAEQRNEIESLKKTFDEIREKNSSLHDELNVYRTYAEESKPYMIGQKLPGKSYAVIAGQEPDEEALGFIQDAVSTAGATVPVTIEIADSSVFEDPNVVQNLASLWQIPPDPQMVKDRFFTELAEQLVNASNTGILDTLEQLGTLQLRGVLAAPVSGVVLLGALETRNLQGMDVPLIQHMLQAGMPVTGVGGPGTPDSVLSEYKKQGISTVDHVNTVPGQVAMVMVLEGRSGNYGSGSSATRLLPEPAPI